MPRAVVVGSGPNGLAGAIVLARAGLDVVVREAAAGWGGGTRTEELTLPGFRHDVCSAIHPLARWSPCLSRLELGIDWLESPACLAHPLDDEEAVLLWRDVAATAAGLGRDAGTYRRLFPWGLARGLASAERVARRFETRRARALLAGCAAHSLLPLERRPSAAFALVLLGLGHRVGWPFPRGGSQSIADALVARLRDAGGEVVTSSAVDELPRAEVVLGDVAPRELLRIARLEDPALRRFRHGPGAFKLDWALSGPIPWRDPRVAQAATVHLGGTYEEIAASERAPGTAPPFVLLAQPSLWDDTRAPAGRHTAWAYCHVPSGSGEDMTEAVEAQVERFAPGFRERILARSARGPRELEAHDRNLVGGDVNGGLMDLRQLWTRPAPRPVPWRTPLRGVYLCSASTPPGGGVHGLCGWAAARVALHDLRRGRN